jgi:hypothetical protein
VTGAARSSHGRYLVLETEGSFSPQELTYEGGELYLTITFEGQENVRPRA